MRFVIEGYKRGTVIRDDAARSFESISGQGHAHVFTGAAAEVASTSGVPRWFAF